MNNFNEKDATCSFIDLKIYQKHQFFLKFKKKKIEKAFILENFTQNSFLLNFLICTLGFSSFFQFSDDPTLLITLQGFSFQNFLTYIILGGLAYLIKRNRKQTIPILVLIRILFEILFLETKMRIFTNYDQKSAFISILAMNILSNAYCIKVFYLNLLLNFLSNTIIAYSNNFSLYDWICLMLFSGLISYLEDVNARQNWIFLDKQRKSSNMFMFLYNNSINPDFIIDQNKRILSMNFRAQEIFEFSNCADPDSKDIKYPLKKLPIKNNTTQSNFLKLLKPSVQENFEEQLIKSKEFTTSAFGLELVLPRKYCGREDLKLRYTEAEGALLEELMGRDSLFEEFSEENNSLDPKNKLVSKKIEGQNMYIDINGNGKTLKLMDGSDLALEMFFNANVKPILWGSRPCFLLEFKDILNEKNILLKTLTSYDEIRESLMEILACLENDYVKWNNLQGNSQGSILIKDGDLKNLANGIYMINLLINRVSRKKEMVSFYLGNPIKSQKKFHLQNTLIYLLEVALLKNVEKLWEINLSFEDSFPDYVNGDYYRFKTVIFIFLKIVFIYTDFPKHSKFKIHGKLKEIVNSNHNEDGKYILLFDFDMPRHQKQIQLMQLLLNQPLFNDVTKLKPLFLHPSNRKENRQEFLIFKAILDILNSKTYISDQDPNRFMISFEFAFNIVNQLDTLLGGSSRLDDNNGSNISNNYSPSRNSFNHKLLNLSFTRNLLKRNHFVWKPKQKKNEKNMHQAISNSNSHQLIKISSKEIKKENSNTNINIEIKKFEENSTNEVKEESQQKLKKQNSNVNSTTNDEQPSQNPRRNLKRRESKVNFLSKNNSIIKMEAASEENKSEDSEIEPNLANFDHRKSHFCTNQAGEKSKEISTFPHLLNSKLCELKEEKAKILKKLFMKDILVLLKQQALNHQKKIGNMFKSEAYLPHIDSNHKGPISNEYGKLKEPLKYNSFSSIDELRKFDYEGYRDYVMNKCPAANVINTKLLDPLQNLEPKIALSEESKPFFSSLFSTTQQRNYFSLKRFINFFNLYKTFFKNTIVLGMGHFRKTQKKEQLPQIPRLVIQMCHLKKN